MWRNSFHGGRARSRLNTSFNVMGKPIAHSVEDVLAVFYSTGLDAVFIEDLLIEK
jgi:carbamoyltransferase